MARTVRPPTARASDDGGRDSLRVLLLCAYFPPEIGTAAHLFHELAVELASRGHRVSVVTGFPRYNVPAEVAAANRGLWRGDRMDGIDVLRVWWPRFRRSFMLGRGIEHLLAAASMAVAALASRRHDVVLVYSPPLTLGLAAWLFAKARRVPFVFNVQDLFPQSAIDLGVMKSRPQIAVFRWLERFIYRRAACVTVHSQGNAEHVLRAAGDRARVAVVANWPDEALFQRRPKAPRILGADGGDGMFVVSFAGTMGLSQDLDTILRAAHLLRDRKDIVFLLVGDGICKAGAERTARDLALRNVRFLPMQPRAEYPQVLSTSDVSLVTLKRAVQTPVVPSKLLSIMASGRPAIVAVEPSGDTARLVEEAKCGLCVPPEDPPRLAEAIRALHSERDLARQMGENGRAYALKHFSVRVCAGTYEGIFDAVVRGGAPTSATTHARARDHDDSSRLASQPGGTRA
jgi:colanic acid biosynthesis glycosyl transferase WcaI